MIRLINSLILVVLLFDPPSAKADGGDMSSQTHVVPVITETCESWTRLPNLPADQLSERVENGLCSGEIFATYTVLLRENLICVPNDVGKPHFTSRIVVNFIKQHPEQSTLNELSATSFWAILDELHCPDH